MKKSFLLLLLLALKSTFVFSADKLHFDLEKPLLLIKEENGFLACAYINVETCNKTGEACAIVSGVNNYDDMKATKIVAVSEQAKELGINVGDTGQSALEKMC